jgi:hypothetical protein
MERDILKKISEMIEVSGTIKPGTVTHVLIRHEANCPAIKTERIADCICNPLIKRMSKNELSI